MPNKIFLQSIYFFKVPSRKGSKIIPTVAKPVAPPRAPNTCLSVPMPVMVVAPPSAFTDQV